MKKLEKKGKVLIFYQIKINTWKRIATQKKTTKRGYGKVQDGEPKTSGG